MMTFIIIMSVFMGVVVGMLGGGGSVLTVPLLVYIAGLDPSQAIPTSLAVLACTSSVAVLRHARKSNVLWRLGLCFGGAAALGAFVGGNLARFVPDPILMGLFASLMLVAGFAMIRPTKTPTPSTPTSDNVPWGALVPGGVLVGVFTGLVGAGGGFLVVPVLVILAGIPMQRAIGTSLFIILMNSTAGLCGHLQHASVDLFLAGSVTAAAIMGTLMGSSLVYRLEVQTLRRAFAAMVFVMATGIIVQLMWPVWIQSAFAI